MLGTTRFLTDASGGQIEPAVYTAFGELASGTSSRFGYVGAHGYQTSDEMPYQHVGARYYDPTTGRFLQRDPIGVQGGLNVYAYVLAQPTGLIDPTGLQNWPTNVGPDAEWLPPPPDLPSGADGWKLHPSGWYPKFSIPKPAFEFTPGVFGACVLAAGVGYGVGTGIDYAVGKVTGKKLSDRIGEWMYRTCPGCFDWTVFDYEDSLDGALLPRAPDKRFADTDAVALAPGSCVAGANHRTRSPASARVSG